MTLVKMMNNFTGFLYYLYLKYLKDFTDLIFGLLILPFLVISFPFMWIWNEWDEYKEYKEHLKDNK